MPGVFGHRYVALGLFGIGRYHQYWNENLTDALNYFEKALAEHELTAPHFTSDVFHFTSDVNQHIRKVKEKMGILKELDLNDEIKEKRYQIECLQKRGPDSIATYRAKTELSFVLLEDAMRKSDLGQMREAIDILKEVTKQAEVVLGSDHEEVKLYKMVLNRDVETYNMFLSAAHARGMTTQASASYGQRKSRRTKHQDQTNAVQASDVHAAKSNEEADAAAASLLAELELEEKAQAKKTTKKKKSKKTSMKYKKKK